jgi:hypothetical protein
MADNNSRIVLMYEGQLLNDAGVNGDSHSAHLAHCMIDGAFNALIRIEGVDAAASFSFAVSDRVVGRIKAPTTWSLPKMNENPPVEPVPPSSPPPRQYSFWAIFAIGWCLGLMTAFGFLIRVSI